MRQRISKQSASQPRHDHDKSWNASTIVTGASSGVGREFAHLAAQEQQHLILIGRDNLRLQSVAEECVRLGAQAEILSLDLQDRDCFARIESFLEERQLYCDILINSAGLGVLGDVAAAGDHLQLELVDVNIRATLALTLKFLPGMIARGRGGILNLGSITAYAPVPYMAAYCASKAFVRSFSAALSAELTGTGVTVTCVAPGILRTPFFEREGMGRSRLIKMLPHGSAGYAAKRGWNALKRGRSLAIPRHMDRVVINVCRALPDRVLTWLTGRFQRTP